MQYIIDNAITTNRLSRNTIMYWVEWLHEFNAVPDNHIELIEFIIEQETHIGDALNEIIPQDWRKD